jgi:hypothetical protein
MKQKINLIGSGFRHDVCSSAGSIPKLMEWDKNCTSDISIYVDTGILSPINKTTKNYAWLSESKTIIPSIYQWCSDNINYLEENFELIFTHDISLLKLSDKFKLVICNARPWVKNHNLYEKTKLVSMIASSKTYCKEHLYRQEIIKRFKDNIDLYGRGHNEIPYKEIGLNDYHFSITMENHTYPIAYSEKITDCFATGTIPVYYGCDLQSVFNADGIIMLNDNFDINSLTPDLYHSKMDAIKDNYNSVINMPIAEDYIYENYIK